MFNELFQEMFDDDTMSIGYELCRAKKVKLAGALDNEVKLKVNNKYDVGIKVGLDESVAPEVACSCTKAQRGENCEHMAAALAFIFLEDEIEAEEIPQTEDDAGEIAAFVDRCSEEDVKFFLSMLLAQDENLLQEFAEYVNVSNAITGEQNFDIPMEENIDIAEETHHIFE